VHYIELFAGCGGLSLGLKSVGLKLVLANELSPMASESYAFNFFGEDLQALSKEKDPKVKRTLWLSSQYTLDNLKARLREDPRDFPVLSKGVCDIAADGSNLNGSLIVGSIVELNKWLKLKPRVAAEIRKCFGADEVDLVSGGPPCQSFSMAGLRELKADRNSLPWEFAKFAQTVQPKLVLLENVTGILRPFKNQDGKSFYAWFELAKAFAVIGYIPLCLHVNAKVAGVPQNRPRFILLGIRADIFKQLKKTFNVSEKALLKQPEEFFHKTKNGEDADLESLTYRDVTRVDDLKLFKGSFLRSVVVREENYVTVKEAIDDLRNSNTARSSFSDSLHVTFSKVLRKNPMRNHELRANTDLVRRRFRLYQILQSVDNSTKNNVLKILKGTSFDLSDDDWEVLKLAEYFVEPGVFVRFKNKEELLSFLVRHPTKKQTQKALIANQPAPAALSIPDDGCHYHQDELRTLTVREMARIQSFPDNFEFRSKTTTGGKMRKFEVPQYTQVGNAVPPLLGRALGLAVTNLLKRLEK
jgi:DNA (cytosine-5)-methyltransferase 1